LAKQNNPSEQTFSCAVYHVQWLIGINARISTFYFTFMTLLE